MGTYNLQSVISDFASVGELIAASGGPLKALPTNTHSLYQDKTNVISQLINGISKLLQKLPKFLMVWRLYHLLFHLHQHLNFL